MKAPFDPQLALQTLERYGVRYVVVGGVAARLHGSPTVTNDLDICYARDSENLGRLAAALSDIGARLRGAPKSVPFKLSARTLAAGDHFTFETRAGNLDILGTPAGTEGFEALSRCAEKMELSGMRIRVTALDDLIAMKRAAGRPKDLIELEILGAVRDEKSKRRR